jgi:hypothetical protein
LGRQKPELRRKLAFGTSKRGLATPF